MKVLTLNTWLIPWAKDVRKRRKKIVNYIQNNNYDVIFLQEVWLNKDVRYFVSKLKEYNHISGGGFIVNKTGLLTLFKGKQIRRTRVYHFPFTKDYSFMQKIAKKGFIHTKIRKKEILVDLINTHLVDYSKIWAKKANKKNIEALKFFVRKSPNVVMCGDFNYRSKDMDKIKFLKSISKEKTFRKENKYVEENIDEKLDYVFYKNLKAKKNKIVKYGLSDHYGIEAEFE